MATKLRFTVDGRDYTGVMDNNIDEMVQKEIMESAKTKLAPLSGEICAEGCTVIFDIDTRDFEFDNCSETLAQKIRMAFAI